MAQPETTAPPAAQPARKAWEPPCIKDVSVTTTAKDSSNFEVGLTKNGS